MIKRIAALALAALLVVGLLPAQNAVQKVRLWDTNLSHSLLLKWLENDTAHRTLNFLVAGANRSLTISGDSYIDQDVRTTAWPTFAGITSTIDFGLANSYEREVLNLTATTTEPTGANTDFGPGIWFRTVSGGTTYRNAVISSGHYNAALSFGVLRFSLYNDMGIREAARLDWAGNFWLGPPFPVPTPAGQNTLYLLINTGASTAVANYGQIYVDEKVGGGYPYNVYTMDSSGNTCNINQNIGTDGTPSWPHAHLTVADGTAPLEVTSTTVIPNLNSDLLDGNHAAAFLLSGTTALDDLSDVDAAAPSNGEALIFNSASGNWENAAVGVGALALNDLSDLNVPAPTDGYALVWDSGTSKWIDADVGLGAVALDDLSDVNAAAPNDNDALTWDTATGKWIAEAGGGGGAPTDAKYIVGLANASLSAEKVKPQLYNNYDIDDAPAAPNALDDELDNASLDVKWTKVNDPAGANAISETAYPGYIWVGLPEQAGTDNYDSAVRLYQAAPAGNAAATYIAKVCLGVSGLESSADAGEFAMVGIYLGNSTDDEFTGSAIQFNDGPGDQFSCNSVGFNNGASGTWVNATFNNYQIIPAGGSFYLKIEKTTTAAYTSANTYNMYYSFNGIVWEHIGQQAKTFTHNVNEVGVIFRLPKAQGGSPLGYALCDFFRRTI